MPGQSFMLTRVLICCFTFGFSIEAFSEDDESWIQQYGWESVEGPIVYDSEKKFLLTAHSESAILWDVQSGLAVRRYPFKGNIRSLHFLGKDSVLIASNRIAIVFNKVSGEVEHNKSLGQINDNHFLHFSEMETVWVISCGREEVRVWDFFSDETVQTFAAEGKILFATVSPDQDYLLTGAADGVGILWNLKSGHVHQRFKGETEIRQALFNSDGQQFLTIGSGEFWYTPRVIVWETKTATPLLTIPRVVIRADFVDDQIMLTYPDGTHEAWDRDRHEVPPPKEEWEPYTYQRGSRRFYSDDNWSLHVDSNAKQVTLHHPPTAGGELKIPVSQTFQGTAYHRPLDFSKSGRFLLTGCSTFRSGDGNAAIWDLNKGALHHSLHSPESVLFGQFSNDEKYILYGHHTELNLMDLESKEIVQSFKVQMHENYSDAIVTSIQLSRNGQKLLTSLGDWYDGDGGGVLLWDVKTGEIEKDFLELSKAVMFAGFNSDESKIVLARSPGDDGSSGINELNLLDVVSGEFIQTRKLEKSWHSPGRIDPTGNVFSSIAYRSGSETHPRSTSVTCWNIQSLNEINEPMIGQGPIWNATGRIACYLHAPDQLQYFDFEKKKLLQRQSTGIADGFSAIIHPENTLIAGARSTYRNDMGVSVVLEEILSGELAAELFLFNSSPDWLIRIKSGDVYGSHGGLARVTRRTKKSLNVLKDSDFVKSVTNQTKVSQKLNTKALDDANLVEALSKQPLNDFPELQPAQTERVEWYDWSWDRRTKIAEMISEAGGSSKANIHNIITYVYLERCEVSEHLLKELRFAGAIDRLYLAETGISDQQLDYISILPHVKRMSLWGNPITDAGLTELLALKKLEVLDLHGTQVTSAGLNLFSDLPQLKTLIIPAYISVEELEILKTTRPELEIIPRALK